MTEWFVSSAVLAALLIGAHYLLQREKSAQDCSSTLWLVLLVQGCCCRFPSGKPPSAWQISCRRLNRPLSYRRNLPLCHPRRRPVHRNRLRPQRRCRRPHSRCSAGVYACADGNEQRGTGKSCTEARRFRAEDIHACMGLRRGFAGPMVPALQLPVRTAAAGGRSARDCAEGGPSGCPADANRAVAVPVRAFPARDLRDNGLRAGRAAAAPLRGARIYALSPPRPHLGRPARRVPRAALV